MEWYYWRVNLCFFFFSGMGIWFFWVIIRVFTGVGFIEEDDLLLLYGRYWFEEMEEWVNKFCVLKFGIFF